MNSIIKRTAALLTAVMISLAAASCGSKTSDSSENAAPEETEAPVTVTLPPKEESEPEETTTAEVSELTTTDPGEQPEEDEVPYTPAVWKVTSPDGKSIYMMGSMHALKDECYPLPDYVESAYRQADVLAVECDITDSMSAVAATLKYTDKLTYTDGETVADHLDKGEWEDIASYIELHGDDPADFESYQLWYLSQLLESYAMTDAGLDAALGIDMYLLNDAHDTGKEIFEVESAEAQMDLLVNFSDDIYSATLSGYCAENNDDIRQQMEDMYEGWRSGDLDKLDSDLSENDELSKEEKELMEQYYQQLLYDRNVGMAEAAKTLMSEGKNVFYIVGAAHYVGDKGIIALLEADGYTAERVE